MRYDGRDQIEFTCNICGTPNAKPFLSFHREAPDCSGCGSSPRFRGTMLALSNALYGRSLIVRDFPADKSIKGVGMSDWEGYASILTEKFSFQNTYYDSEPRLDIMAENDWMRYGDLDFVLCTEVLEHIPAPFSQALVNVRRMLKPGGTLVFSTPYTDRAETKEHFPGLFQFTTTELAGRWVVVNRDRDGGYSVFDNDICFHGGPGTVLEMRVFSEKAVLDLLRDTGFEYEVLDQVVTDVGYAWPNYEERPGDGVGQNYIIQAKPK